MTSIAPVVTLSPRGDDAVLFDLDGVYKGRKKGSLKGSPERVAKLRAEKNLTAAQIAAIEGISERTVKSYLQRHRLPLALEKVESPRNSRS